MERWNCKNKWINDNNKKRKNEKITFRLSWNPEKKNNAKGELGTNRLIDR